MNGEIKPIRDSKDRPFKGRNSALMGHSAVRYSARHKKVFDLSSNESFNRKPSMSFDILGEIYNMNDNHIM